MFEKQLTKREEILYKYFSKKYKLKFEFPRQGLISIAHIAIKYLEKEEDYDNFFDKNGHISINAILEYVKKDENSISQLPSNDVYAYYFAGVIGDMMGDGNIFDTNTFGDNNCRVTFYKGNKIETFNIMVHEEVIVVFNSRFCKVLETSEKEEIINFFQNKRHEL